MCACCVHLRDAPGLGPDPSLVRAAPQSPCPLPRPVLSEPPHLDSALPTGDLAGSVPRPTQTLTHDTDRVQGGGGEGTTNQSNSCPSRGVLRTADPGQKGLLPVAWEGGEHRQRVQSPAARSPVGAGAVGSRPLLPGSATWPGYAHGCTYGAMRGEEATSHRTQTHRAPGSSAGGGPGQSGWGRTPQQGHTQATWEQ